jgi:nucleoid-associated protein YgaU
MGATSTVGSERMNGSAGDWLNRGTVTSPTSLDSRENKGIRLGAPSSSVPGNQVVQAPVDSVAPASPPIRQPAPLGGTPAASVAPLTLTVPLAAGSASSGISQVESYDEETYAFKTGDTFRTISQAFYRSEKYERALLLFNRNHPLAVDGLRVDPPTLQAGQSIYIPPARILEKYYGSLISEAPAPSGAFGGSSSAGASGAAGSGLAAERKYRVGGNGEMFLEIARRTLGNENRWAEIYRLNPRFDPKDPVPAGSELRLPADAQVGSQSIP